MAKTNPDTLNTPPSPSRTTQSAEPLAAPQPTPTPAPQTKSPTRLRSPILWVSTAAFVLAAIFARTPLLHLSDGAVGGDIDGYNNIWNYYWLKTALLDLHRNPYYT